MLMMIYHHIKLTSKHSIRRCVPPAWKLHASVSGAPGEGPQMFDQVSTDHHQMLLAGARVPRSDVQKLGERGGVPHLTFPGGGYPTM